MIRLIRITDVRRAGRYAWNDATGQFCVHNPDKGHYGFWIRDEIKGQRVFKHLMSPPSNRNFRHGIRKTNAAAALRGDVMSGAVRRA